DAALDHRLDEMTVDWDPRAALGVVLAAGGYPGKVRSGDQITGIPDETADGKVFHAGTALDDGKLVTAGGRVLCAVGLGDTIGAAQKRAYALVDAIHWDGAFCRRDIGWRALKR